MPPLALHWLRKAQKLVNYSHSTKLAGHCMRPACPSCRPPFLTIEEMRASLGFYSNETLKLGNPDLRIQGFCYYAPILPVLGFYNPSQVASGCKTSRSTTFQTCRMLLAFAIGTWIMSPRASSNVCNAPGRGVDIDAQKVHRLVSLDVQVRDVITTLLSLAYHTLVGDDTSVTREVQELQQAWSQGLRSEGDVVCDSFSHWTCYSFLYYLSDTEHLASATEVLGRQIQETQFQPVISAINFRSYLFNLQIHPEFGSYKAIYERMEILHYLWHLYTAVLCADDLLSIPLRLEWHFTYVFSGWQLVEEFSNGSRDGLSDQTQGLNFLHGVKMSLQFIVATAAAQPLRTPAVLFCQRHCETWRALLVLVDAKVAALRSYETVRLSM